MLSYDEYLNSNYNLIRSEYESMLVEQWYPASRTSEIDDWRIEYCQDDYNIYLENLKPWQIIEK